MNSDGTNQRKLSDCNELCSEISWSANSQMLLLNTTSLPANTPQTTLLTLDRTSAPVQQYGSVGILSPTNSTIAFTATVDGLDTLFLGGPGYATPVRLDSVPTKMEISALIWSPDGAKLALATIPEDKNPAGNLVLYVSELSAGSLHQIGKGESPAWSPDSTQIAFTDTSETGKPSVSLVRSDGSNLRRLGTGRSPIWSPNGTHLIFMNTEDRCTWSLFLIQSDGSNLRRLGTGQNPSWSPDGSRIAFTGIQADGNRGVYAVGLRSTAPNYVAPGLKPFWSPDGNWIATQDFSLAGNPRIIIAKADGTSMRSFDIIEADSLAWTPDGKALLASSFIRATPEIHVTTIGQALGEPLTYGIYPTFAPGGRHIAFVRDGQLCLIGAVGKDERCLTSGLEIQQPPVWAPDGRSIALISGPTRPSEYKLYLIQADGAGLRQIASCGATLCYPPSWAPDSTALAFEADDGIYTVAASGGPVRRLGDGESPAWSPDGKQIAFSHNNLELMINDLWLMDADGTNARALFGEAYPAPPAWSDDGQKISFATVNFTGQYPYYTQHIHVGQVGTGTVLFSVEGNSAHWTGYADEIMYLCRRRPSFFAAPYGKLCGGVLGTSESGVSWPPGYGDIESYDLLR